MRLSNQETELLKQLAVATVEKPRSTIKELAEAVGISKATLHRFCGTRENLEVMLAERVTRALNTIIDAAEKDYDDYKIGLGELIIAHYEEKEFLLYHFNMQSCMDEEYWMPYSKAVDSFFLNGQKQGAFRLDFGVVFLSEMFTTGICGLIESERRGRIGKSGMSKAFEDFFLRGTLNTEKQ